MRGAPYWHVLGIEPTASEAAVRAAYAEKLKVTNPEDDAEGFKRLRAAYEAALSDARWRARAPPPRPPAAPGSVAENDGDLADDYIDDAFIDDEYHDDYIGGHLPPPPTRPLHVPHVRPNLTPEPVDPEREAHRQACSQLETLLHSRAPADDITRAYEAVRRSPAMTMLDVYTNTEHWLVNLLHGARPASHVLIDRAIADFGWEKAAGRLRDRSGASSIVGLRKYVAQEQEAAALIARVQDKRHEFNAAYREIMRPIEGRSWLSRQKSLLRAGLMQRFLDYIAAKSPIAEESFDQDALAWWRSKLSKSKSPTWLWHVLIRGGVGVAIIAGIIAFTPPATETPSTDITSEVHDERTATRTRCVIEASGFAPSTGGTGHCERMLELAPESLLMRQFAGIVALRAQDNRRAIDHFDSILVSAPNNSYALYGAGLARAFSIEPEERGGGLDMMAQALAANPGVPAYFQRFRLPALNEAVTPSQPRAIAGRMGPYYDTPPGDLAPVDQAAIQEAMAYFGMTGALPAGRVVIECISHVAGTIDECLIVEETPANLGLGEVALRLSPVMRLAPATRNGEPVDLVPIRLPFAFGPPPDRAADLKDHQR